MKRLETDLSADIWTLPSFPVVLVTDGRNIMTAGAFHFYSFDPPSLVVGIMPDKYTHELIDALGEFGVNIPRADQIGVARMCGSVSGREVTDKYERAGITPFVGEAIESCLIKECPLNIECRVVHKSEHPGTHTWFVGEIKAVHVADDYKPAEALMFWGKEYRRVGEFLERA